MCLISSDAAVQASLQSLVQVCLLAGVMLFLLDAWLRERARLLAQISQGKEDLAALQRLHFQTAWRWTQRPLAEVIDASPPAAMVEEDDADCGFFIHPSRSGWGS